jgi:uncharacterized protein GlcG (DUF336 family)
MDVLRIETPIDRQFQFSSHAGQTSCRAVVAARANDDMCRRPPPNRARLCVTLWLCVFALLAGAQGAVAQSATYSVRLLTPEAALKAATSALEVCRLQGYQVTVAVADRAGVTQLLLRDRFAGPHTVETAMNKAWTAISFRQDTLAFDIATAREPRAAGARSLPRIVAVGGGVLIEAAGSILGAIAVSGAPGGEADDQCAKAGLASIRDEIEF